MRKISFYKQTWLVSVSIIVLTLLISFSIFIAFTGFFLQQNQQRQFDETSKNIRQMIEKEGINKTYFEELILSGYYIIILGTDDQVIYPKGQTLVYTYPAQPFSEEDFPSSGGIFQAVELTQNESTFLADNFTVGYQQVQYSVKLLKNISISSEDYQGVIITAAPIFLITGLLVSGIISTIYAQYFKRKIQHVNQTIDQMSQIDYHPVIIESNDEMQILENNVSYLYLELKKNLEQLQKDYLYIESLEKERNLFMKGATHELKTPIMAMQTVLEGYFAELPDTEYSDPEYVMRKCQSQLRSMTKLVNELLSLSSVELAKETAEIDVKEALETVIQWSQILIDEKNQKIVVDLPTITMFISKKMLLKIFSNIISNATHHGKANSNIEISLVGRELIFRNQINQQVEEVEKLFQPFYTTQEDDYEGHGLGLYLVKNSLSNYGYETLIRLPEPNTFELVILLTNQEES
ncbi:two-component system, OmpR family, sensor kinase Ihk [Enterococcus sp. AZ194]|uniref:sensor histidine kinase n=1 Tax=Enterococcus sp. AZ194 TaxID=2774629 RepID=UPI003F21DD2F